MFKRIALIVSAVTFMFSTSAYAKTVEFIIDKPTYASIDKYEKETNALLAAPFIQNDRTMIPVRAVSESFGSLVSWDPNTRAVTISKDGKTVKLTIDSLTANVDGTETALDAAPCIVSDTTFVPVRFVSEALGYNVNFVPRTRSVLVCDRADYMTVNGKAVTYPEYEAMRYVLATPELTGVDLTNSTKAYLLKNAVLSVAADKASVGLTQQSDQAINLALEQYDENLPFTIGAFAPLMENEEKGFAYIDSVYNASEVQNAYETDYICAKHVLILSGTDSEQQATAKKAYEQAASGADFDKLIEDFGEDPGVVNNPDGYVFSKGEMIDAFETAAYSLKIGEISKPVKSEYGYHIIKRLPLPALSEITKQELIFNLYVAPLMNSSVVE